MIRCSIKSIVQINKNKKKSAVLRDTSLHNKNCKSIWIIDSTVRILIRKTLIWYSCWTPYCICGFLAYLGLLPPVTLVTVCCCMAKASTVLNPIVNFKCRGGISKKFNLVTSSLTFPSSHAENEVGENTCDESGPCKNEGVAIFRGPERILFKGGPPYS